MSATAPTDVLIVGGGIAGYTAATTLRDLGYEGAITIVEKDSLWSDHPPLSKQVLVEGTALADVALASPARLAELRITIESGVAAAKVSPSSVVLSDGRVLTSAALIVAVGAAANRPTFPGADSSGVVTLRGYSEAIQIRAASGPGRTILVLGGGFVGAEVAASLRMLGTSVVLVDPHELPGAHVLGDTLAGWLHAMHVSHGVDVRTTTVDSITSRVQHDHPLSVALGDGTTIEADLVVAGVGVSRRVLEGSDLVHEAGGVVIAPTAHWDTARLDGQDAATRLLGGDPAPRGTPWYWTDRYGSHIEITGDLMGDGVDVLRPGVAVFRVSDNRLLGAASIDDPMTVRAARRIIDRGVPVDPALLADPSVPLRRMLTP